MADLFERHAALFVDKEENDGVFPRLIAGREESLVSNMFNAFFEGNVVYDMTHQWIVQPGPFKYEYDWLTSGAKSEVKQFVDGAFEHAYGVTPDAAIIL